MELHLHAGSQTKNRLEVVSAAVNWIGSPYKHRGCLKGVGCDCLGLIRGVFKDLYGYDAETPPPYNAGWAEASGREDLRDAGIRHLVPIATSDRKPGDVLLFRMKRNGVAKHAAILSFDNQIIHAYSNHAVMETPLPDDWTKPTRLAFAFQFPGVVD